MADPRRRGSGRAWAAAALAVAAACGAWLALRDSETAGSADPSEDRAEPAARPPSGPRSGGGGGEVARGSAAASVGVEDMQVAGVLIDAESGPLAEGRIELWCADGRLGAVARLDEVGRFVGPACTEGQTCVRLQHPVAVQPRPWSLSHGAAERLEVELAPRLEISVRADGRAVADALALVRSGEGVRSASTDLAGELEVALPRLRPCDPCDAEGAEGGLAVGRCRGAEAAGGAAGELTILVQADGFAPSSRALSLTLEDIEGSLALAFDLEAAAPAITGEVVDARGRPFDARTRMLARSLDRPDEAHAAKLDAAGQFELSSLGRGQYRLRAVRDGLEIASLDAAEGGEVLRLVSDRPASGPTITIRVEDGSGRPLPGVRVDGGPFSGAITDEAGAVERERVLPGDYALRLRAHGCEAQRRTLAVSASAGEALEVGFALPGC
ncbi:carboxypeptidase regulatory-like domain-containing protein [Pseudenhygromyxa sp. WMMC2535]|uniref:carboxypeptidase-like regulatory domain-containing protein n=1 Tax=Pseudenhygromyxa sp. WMMC2535 TaxID=2712867 RepID=UPI001595BCB1|nr:carboxypeptidase-like regulatory domain-containing protein [Pseudenhygromyxa sp. WMMC2535]NVB42661.1 carboxypeptidase regulatory-like domain-containing protein [Pseudenhygromyxa sp. WMMC2535]